MPILFVPIQKEQVLIDSIGKYRDLMNYAYDTSVVRDVFGPDFFHIAYDFPTGLSRFVASVQYIWRLNEDQLIDENTLLPYYALFVSPKRLARARRAMKGSKI